MFVLTKEMSWVWPVEVLYPRDGEHVRGQFRARFRPLSAEQVAATQASADPLGDMLRQVVMELLDLADETGAPLPHSPELLEAVLRLPFARAGLSAAYVASVSEAPVKNSVTPAAAG